MRLKNYLAPRPRQKSQYDRYPLPFFSADARCTWDVTPTGNDTAHCETGTAYALLALLFQYQAISTRRQSGANLVYRDFTRVGGAKTPDAKTMGRWGVALGGDVIKQIHIRMVTMAQSHGLTEGRRMRVDTTVVETNIHDRYDLRRDIRFHTRVTAATSDQAAERWLLTTDDGATVSCRHYIMATGCLSSPKPPEIDGVSDFKGEVYFTGRWPHEEVNFAGKSVAVIGTGSSGIQAIPLIAEQAAHLTVFQRTPNFALPAHNGPVPADRVALLESDLAGYREQAISLSFATAVTLESARAAIRRSPGTASMSSSCRLPSSSFVRGRRTWAWFRACCRWTANGPSARSRHFASGCRSVDQGELVVGGMSGSPILSPDGRAIGLMSTGEQNPILKENLPRWFFRR